MQEHRAVVRAVCEFPGQHVSSEGSTVFENHIIDVSVQGLGLLARTAGKPGERVRLNFILPSEEEPLVVEGIVRWVASGPTNNGWYPLGIEFWNLDDTQRYRLAAFVADAIQQFSHHRLLSGTGMTTSQLPRHVTVSAWLLLVAVLVTGFLGWVLMLEHQLGRLSRRLTEEHSPSVPPLRVPPRPSR